MTFRDAQVDVGYSARTANPAFRLPALRLSSTLERLLYFSIGEVRLKGWYSALSNQIYVDAGDGSMFNGQCK